MDIKEKIDKIKFLRLDENQKFFLYIIEDMEEYICKKEPDAEFYIKDNLPYFIIFHDTKMIYYNHEKVYKPLFNFYGYLQFYTTANIEKVKSIIFEQISNYFNLKDYLIVCSIDMHNIKIST